MARSAVELDFFQMEREGSSAKSQPNKLFDRRRSFRGIQSVISKLNPELLKTVIASGSVDHNNYSNNDARAASKSPPISVPSTPRHDETPLFPALPLFTPAFGGNVCAPQTMTPLTIFYNGNVTVFDVSRLEAENILKLAEEKVISKTVESADPTLAGSSIDETQLLEALNGDLIPLARRKSLQRFLEKRKQRLTLVSPYGYPTSCAFPGQKGSEN